MARVSKHSYGIMLRFAAEAIFEDLFNENGEVFSYDKNSHLPQNYKKQCSLGKVQKEPERSLTVLE